MKKAWHIIKAILLWLVVALAVCMMGFTIVSVNTFDRMDRSLFGYKAFIVLSDSMSATDFNAGDLIPSILLMFFPRLSFISLQFSSQSFRNSR